MEINKYISKKTIIYICILIIIIISLRVLYSKFYLNIEGFSASNSPATDLLSKLKSSDAQLIANSNDLDLEMQINTWNNQMHNTLSSSQQSKAIAFYKPKLTINDTKYAKLGDIVSQNTDYSLPSIDQFTLLVKKYTSDIKPPVRFEVMATIENPNFNSSYYEFSNYINNTANINKINTSIVNCASVIKNLNSIIQQNLETIQKKLAFTVYNNNNINSGTNITILKLLEQYGGVVEGFSSSDSTVDTGYTDFVPSPLINTPYKDNTPLINLSASNSNKIVNIININSDLVLPAGTTGYITYNGETINIDIPANIDSAQGTDANAILKKLPAPYNNFASSKITVTSTESELIFSYIPIKIIMNFIISLCNDINNINSNYVTYKRSDNNTNTDNVKTHLSLPNKDSIKTILDVINSNINNVNTFTLNSFLTSINKQITSITAESTILDMVFYIMNTMKITYRLSSISFKPSDITSIFNLSKIPNPKAVATPKYIGCYKDTNARAIPDLIGGYYTSVEQCAKDAYNRNNTYNIIGLQNGNECWAGFNPDYAKYGYEIGCSAALGGPWTNQVYSINEPMTITITNVNNDIFSNISSSNYNIMTNSLYTSQNSKMNTILSKLNNFSNFISDFNSNKFDYFPLKIYKPIAPDNYISLGHVFGNTEPDLKKIIESNNVACIPSHCVKEMRDWTTNDKIFEYNQNNKYFAIYFNPYTGTFISTNTDAQQLPDGKVCKVVACVAKCTAVDDLKKADDCSRKYYNLNKKSIVDTPLTSTLVSNQEEEFYLDKIKAQSDSITRLKQRAQKMQTDTDKATIVNREMNKNKLQEYVDVQKQNIDIIMKRLQADKNKIQTNVNIPSDTLNSLIQMIKDSTLLNTDQKTSLLTQISSSQNLSSSEYNAKLNQVLKSCPQYDLSGLVSKKQASDVCYGCDTPK